MRALLVLFMVQARSKTGGMGLERPARRRRFSACIRRRGLPAANLPGGWIADRLLGAQKLDLVSAASSSCSGISPWPYRRSTSRSSSACCSSCIRHRACSSRTSARSSDELYASRTIGRRDSGFTIFYMGINLGAVRIGLPRVQLPWARTSAFGWHYGFAAAGVGMLIGLMAVPPFGALPARRRRRLKPLSGPGRARPTRARLSAGLAPSSASASRCTRSWCVVALLLTGARRQLDPVATISRWSTLA